jgi:anti-anti-sigma factor
MQRSAITIDNQIGEISRVADLVDEFGRECALTARVVNDMHVALDEVLSNIIHHGYDDRGRHRIEVRLSIDGGEFCADVIDDGRPFDPARQKLVPINRETARPAPGGLGLHFVAAVIDNIRYRRDGAMNRLELRKRTSGNRASRTDRGMCLDWTEIWGRDMTVLEVSGQIDSTGAGALRERLTALIAAGTTNLLVDLHGVDYVSSAGFWALLAGARLLEARSGRLLLCGLSGEVQRLFDLTSLDQMFTIYPNRELAIAGMRKAAL